MWTVLVGEATRSLVGFGIPLRLEKDLSPQGPAPVMQLKI